MRTHRLVLKGKTTLLSSMPSYIIGKRTVVQFKNDHSVCMADARYSGNINKCG